MLVREKKTFQRPLNESTDVAEDISTACLILHNFVCLKSGFWS